MTLQTSHSLVASPRRGPHRVDSGSSITTNRRNSNRNSNSNSNWCSSCSSRTSLLGATSDSNHDNVDDATDDTNGGDHSGTKQVSFHRNKEMDTSTIRFLGMGPNALVREGVVLVAPPEEYNHFLMRSALFVYAMGMDDDYNEAVIRCVVLDNPTPFTLGEMATGLSTSGGAGGGGSSTSSLLLNNLIYRGGNLGGETAMMLHSRKELEREEIGTSGIFEGGLAQALSLVSANGANGAAAETATAAAGAEATTTATTETLVNDFKFFFNYCQFSPVELETMLDVVDPETGDAWMSFEVPPELILEEWDKNECWRYLRNEWKKRKRHHDLQYKE